MAVSGRIINTLLRNIQQDMSSKNIFRLTYFWANLCVSFVGLEIHLYSKKKKLNLALNLPWSYRSSGRLPPPINIIATWRRWVFSFTFPGHCSPKKRHLLPIEYEARWAPQPVWMFSRIDKSLSWNFPVIFVGVCAVKLQGKQYLTTYFCF